MSIQKGDTVGDYKVLDLAGSGGMGTVYKIEHVITKRVEAMKLLPVGIGCSPEEVRRFEREIEVQARLHHPHIVSLYNAVRDQRSIALIMEYVEGEALQRVLERGKVSISTSAEWTAQVLDALAYAHAQGVIHRDVTPANIIITPQGAVKLTDFGLALAANDLRLTGSGVPVGSAWYMSPEQVRADKIDARADLYSVGAVLREMLTGSKLFDADGSFAVMRAHIETVPQPPSALNPEVPPALDQVVGRALAKDPAARFQSAGEFREALEAALAPVPPVAVRGRATRLPTLVLGTAMMASALSSVVWIPKSKHVPPMNTAAPVPVVTAPAAAAAPADPPPATAAPETSTEPATPARRSASSAAARQTRKQNFAVTISGDDLDSSPPAPGAPKAAKPDPEERAADSEPAMCPVVPGAVSTSGTCPSPDPGTPAPATPADVKPPKKPGNRFIRALGKLNPLRKPKLDPDPPKAPAENIVK